MIWVLASVGILAGLVMLVAAVGSFLPQEHVASRTLKELFDPGNSFVQADFQFVRPQCTEGPLRWRALFQPGNRPHAIDANLGILWETTDLCHSLGQSLNILARSAR